VKYEKDNVPYIIIIWYGLACLLIAAFFTDRAPRKQVQNTIPLRVISVEPYTFQGDHPDAGIKKGDIGAKADVSVDASQSDCTLPDLTRLRLTPSGEYAGWKVVEAVCKVGEEHKTILIEGDGQKAEVLLIHPEPAGRYVIEIYLHKPTAGRCEESAE
jgi:hypothetical protein